MEILRCEDVRKVYGSGEAAVTALDGVNLRVERGEFVAIVGASGSGKSTLMHLLGGVDAPSAGRVIVDGEDVTGLSPARAAAFRRRKVGLVYQFYNLIPTLSVRQNIELPLRLDGRKCDPARLMELARTLGVAERLDALPWQLSGGQQQRAAIARALIYRPALLLADEPTGNLDKRNGREVVDQLRRANRELGQTILLVTHDEEVALAANRVVTIEDGRVAGDERR